MRQDRGSAGYSLIEMVFVLGLLVTMTAVAVPNVLAMLDAYRAAGAARYISFRLARARAEAIARSADVGIRFVRDAQGYTYTMYVDGNGNGVRTQDVVSGIDFVLAPAERLPENFAGVEFDVVAGLPAIDSSTAPPGATPIHVGSSGIATFTPLGTASSGSLYILGKGPTQWVVRIFGTTGRTRLLEFDPIRRTWNES